MRIALAAPAEGGGGEAARAGLAAHFPAGWRTTLEGGGCSKRVIFKNSHSLQFFATKTALGFVQCWKNPGGALGPLQRNRRLSQPVRCLRPAERALEAKAATVPFAERFGALPVRAKRRLCNVPFPSPRSLPRAHPHPPPPSPPQPVGVAPSGARHRWVKRGNNAQASPPPP